VSQRCPQSLAGRAVGMVAVDELLPGAGAPCQQPFRCQAGCMENAPGGWRCVPAGTPRFAVKKDAQWQGLPGRGGVAAREIAEYCGLCWGNLLAIVDAEQPARDEEGAQCLAIVASAIDP
jgi:hypothetical protein